MDWTKLILEYLLPPLALIATGVLAVLGRAAIRWLGARLGVERAATVEYYARAWADLADDAIGYAEQRGLVWARERGELPPSAEKLELALRWATDEAERRGLPERARHELVALIEARLGRPDTPGEADEARDVVMRLRSGSAS
jgi:hypothetical protein